jgi:tetratricopeptide (TPR) repeat protein
MDYLRLLFFPVALNVFYLFHPVLSIVDPRVLASIIIIVPFVILFVVNVKRKDSAISFAWLFALLPLLPALYIAGAGARGSAFAERYLYLPSAGFIIFLVYWFACFLRRFVKKQANVTFLVVVVLVSVVFSAGTFARNNVWKDNYSLWKDSAEKTLDSDLVYVNLGSAADELGFKAEALSAYESALKINPNSIEAHNNLGVLYFEIKEYELSLKNYEEALSETTRPSELALINENMGNVYYSMDKFDEAVGRYAEAVSIKGAGVDANLLNKLGIALARSGRTKEAIESFAKALDIDPTHVGARKNFERATKP